MGHKFISTGQAAKLCSVTPDTILKWIRSGRLPARRTAGGHHRIDSRDLEEMLRPAAWPVSTSLDEGEQEQNLFRYCWQHNTTGELLQGCRDCVVYQTRAQRCYEVLKLSPNIGHTKLFCEKDCNQCDYYQKVHLQTTNILVVTDDPLLITNLRQDRDSVPYNLEFTDCEYQCSALVDHFRADYVIVDCSMGRERSEDICNHLSQDPRLPYVRLILAVDRRIPDRCDKLKIKKEKHSPDCEQDVFARINRPFGLAEVTNCIVEGRH